MNQPIIEITGLGKKYRIGAHKEPYLSLRDELAKPFRRLSSVLSNLTTHHSPFTIHNSQSSATHNSQSPTTHNSPLTIHNSQQDFWALRDVSFSVNQGEAVGIIGRNGAGKSTLLKILSQITPPTEGKITCRGRIASLLEVGTGFHPELTGRENIYMNGAILGMRRAEITRKFDEIVAFAEVEQFLDTPVKRYSSGMYVRLAFAVAAHLEPEILIVDEVLAVGDAQFQKKCLGKMQDVAKGGRTVLFVSHNMAAIKASCRCGVLLDHGFVVKQGSAIECIETYIGAHHGGDPIISHIERSDPRIQVREIRINGSPNDYIEISPAASSLEIVVEGSLKETLPMDVELIISDGQGIPLAFYSPGYEAGEVSRLARGNFVIKHLLKMPCIVKGCYNITLYLTDPNKNGWVDIPRAATISVSGAVLTSGRVLDYSAGKGFIKLAPSP